MLHYSRTNGILSSRETIRFVYQFSDGKLNVLDEFRVQKEELMSKFQMQEESQKQQEVKYQEMMRDMEKDFILKKNRLVW